MTVQVVLCSVRCIAMPLSFCFFCFAAAADARKEGVLCRMVCAVAGCGAAQGAAWLA
jgi:hypothetical protein